MNSMGDKCIWKYEEAQFAGGPFYSTSCGEYFTEYNGGGATCSNCGKPIEFEAEE